MGCVCGRMKHRKPARPHIKEKKPVAGRRRKVLTCHQDRSGLIAPHPCLIVGGEKLDQSQPPLTPYNLAQKLAMPAALPVVKCHVVLSQSIPELKALLQTTEDTSLLIFRLRNAK